MNSPGILSKARIWCVGSLVAVFSINALHAETITPLNLSDWPEGWTARPTSGTTVDVTNRNGVDYLRIARITGGTGAIAFWDGSDAVSDTFGDFSGSVILQFQGGSNSFGFVVGAENKTYNSNQSTNNQGYSIGVVANSGLGIWKNAYSNLTLSSTNVYDRDNETGGAWSAMSVGAMTSQTGTYQFDFSVSGATINASLWNLDSNDVKVGSAIATLSYTMDSDIEGYFGLFGGRWGSDGRYVFFRDVQLETIPEPRAALLGAAGVVFLFCRIRKGRRNA